MRILSIDPSLRGTGFAILEKKGSNIRCLEYGVIKNKPKLSMPECLVVIHETLTKSIQCYEPEAVVLEAIIYVQSYPTAIVLGSARGAALLAAAQAKLPIHEYAPKRAKQAVVGYGSALKNQVAFMVRAILGLTETPPNDAADAIAIGLTHFQTDTTLFPRKRSQKTTWKAFVEAQEQQVK